MTQLSLWEQHNVTDLIRQILIDIRPKPNYGSGRPFMTTYQIAVEFVIRFPAVAALLAPSTGGQGQGPYALTTYLGRWLPDRILKRSVTDIELRFLSPQHLRKLEFDNLGAEMLATSNQAGFDSTMFRYTEKIGVS